MATEKGYTVDPPAFDRFMDEQRTRARAAPSGQYTRVSTPLGTTRNLFRLTAPAAACRSATAARADCRAG